MSDTPTPVRTHAHRVTEASFIVGNEAAIIGVLEGRDREIEALRARVGWEVAERNREAGARNVATSVDLDAIEARLNSKCACCTPPRPDLRAEDLRALLAEVRRLTDANAHLERLAAAWKLTAEQTEDEARTARLDGARGMREQALARCRAVSARADARGSEGGSQQEEDIASGAHICWLKIEALDPAAAVGSGS